jgi:hypothetical protein
MGWEPATRTRYEYDADDRVVTAITETEPEFDDDERMLLIAYERWSSERGAHGYPWAEAMSTEADPTNLQGTFRFIAEGPVIDWAERARLDAFDAYRKAMEDAGATPNMHGVTFTVVKRDFAPASLDS